MYSFVYFSFFTNLSKILAVTVWLLFEKDFEYLSIDLYLLQDWSKHFYTRVVFFIRERLQKNLYFYERFYYQTVLRNFRHREISCLATQLGSIPPKEVPGFFKKTQHYPQVSLVKIHLGFNLWWIFGAFSLFSCLHWKELDKNYKHMLCIAHKAKGVKQIRPFKAEARSSTKWAWRCFERTV